MNINEFISKHNLKIDSEVIRLCELGVEVMKNSRDPHHSHRHVFRMLDDLDYFLSKGGGEIEFDYEVLLPAIIWHDCWRSTQDLISGFIFYWYTEFMDGFNGAKMFRRSSEDFSIEQDKIEKIAKCIRVHSTFPDRLPRGLEGWVAPISVEAKLLRDFDHLDMWHTKRLDDLVNLMFRKMTIKFYHVWIGKIWYYLILSREKAERYYFDINREVFKLRKPVFLEKIYHLWDDRNSFGVS